MCWTTLQPFNQVSKTIQGHFKNELGLVNREKFLTFTVGGCEANLSPNTLTLVFVNTHYIGYLK